MLHNLLLKYSDYIIAAGRIVLEIVNLINFGFTVQTLIWINGLEANLDDENIDILKFLGLQNEYKDLLCGLKVLLIIHSIITWLKFLTTCCILCKMCWKNNRTNIYQRLAKYKYRNHMILPTTQESNSQIFARSQDSSGPSEPRNLSNPQDQAILHDSPIIHTAIVHEDRTNIIQNRKSLKEIDSMIERVLHRANAATSQDSSGPSDAHILHAAIGHEDTTNAANQTKILARSEDSSGPSEVRSLSNLPISQDQAILHDAPILHEDTKNRSQNSSSPSDVTNLSTNILHYAPILTPILHEDTRSQNSSSPNHVTNLSTNHSDRRYPLRKRTESTRYPDETYQKDTP